MELANYINRDDLASNVVTYCNIIEGHSKESGKPYYCIEIEFVNGFKKRLFLTDSEKFAVCNAFESLDSK